MLFLNSFKDGLERISCTKHFILLYCVVLNCIVLLIYCYVDIIPQNAMHKFARVLDNLQTFQVYIKIERGKYSR